MTFSISTRWNAFRHRSGEAMLEEILAAGFTHVELGYDLTMDLVPGVLKMLADKAITVDSLHNYCPVPVGAPMGHPELFSLASRNERIRQCAVRNTINTINYATEVGAKVVVIHSGRVEMRNLTRKLIELHENGKAFSPKYERIKLKLLARREKKASRYLANLYRSLEDLLPLLQSTGIRLGLENLPSWEAIPTEPEMLDIIEHFGDEHIGYWHDFGHAQVRQTLGLTAQLHWMKKLSPHLAGVHIHDCIPPAHDHVMPPAGEIDFPAFKDFIQSDIVSVFEPAPGILLEDLREGVNTIRQAWNLPDNQGG